MGVTAETQALRDAASGFTTYGQQFKDTVVPALSRCSIPHEDFPLLDLGFESTYKRSWEQMGQVCRTAAGSMQTIGLALTMVANHYEGQEAENSKMFGGKPIDPTKMAGPQSMDTGHNLWEGAADAVVLGLGGAALYWSVSTLAAAGAPFGLTVPVFAVGSVCILNIVDPAPYFVAADGWSDVERVVTEAAALVPKLATDVTTSAKWTGDGADAFSNFIARELSPVLNALQSLAGALKQMCTQTGWVLLVAMAGFCLATYETSTLWVAATAAEATVVGAPAAEAGALAGFGTWAAFGTGLVMELGSTVGDMAVANSTVEKLPSRAGRRAEREGPQGPPRRAGAQPDGHHPDPDLAGLAEPEGAGMTYGSDDAVPLPRFTRTVRQYAASSDETAVRRIREAADELGREFRATAETTVTAGDPSGHVTAEVSGSGRLRSIDINPYAMRDLDATALGAACREAILAARDRAGEQTKERLLGGLDSGGERISREDAEAMLRAEVDRIRR